MIKRSLSLCLAIGLAGLLIAILFIAGRTSAVASIDVLGTSFPMGEELGGPPWLDEAWHYRRPVTIHNGGDFIGIYQVLIKLDANNFNFSLAKPDGSDVRFTYINGTLELNYWIESWDSADHLAYVWVQVPGLQSGDTTIYLYYNNPLASPASDGLSTFDNFDDDWTQFGGERSAPPGGIPGNARAGSLESPFTWLVLNGSPVVAGGILNLPESTGIRSVSTYQAQQALGFRANYGLGAGYEWGGFINAASGQRTIIGDLPADVDDLYLINYSSILTSTLLEGATDWHNAFHTYEIRWNPGWTEGDIDHGIVRVPLTLQVPASQLPVTFYSYQGSDATMKVDWAYVRQFRNPEPVFTVGAEQGLVELRIGMTDAPDPLPSGEELTYQLAISNTSNIDAHAVIVTDTLPSSVQFSSALPPTCANPQAGVIECSLGDLSAHSFADIFITVIPLQDGIITNTAQVTSLDYPSASSITFVDETTLVDSVPPTVNWQLPVQNGQNYYTLGGLVTLEASASDNDHVAWVEFKYWDHLGGTWVPIGADDTYPYQVPFNSNVLVLNQIYQVFVVGVDRAGNHSNPYDPLQVIYLLRRFPQYMPLAIK